MSRRFEKHTSVSAHHITFEEQRSMDMTRFQMIFTASEINRITFKNDNNIYVDLHGFDKLCAEKFVNNIINTLRHPCTINVIHGYIHGTVLLKMTREELQNPKITKRESVSGNCGITLLNIL